MGEALGLARTPKRSCKTLSCAAARVCESSACPAEVSPVSESSEHVPEVLELSAVTTSFWEWGINTPSPFSLQLLPAFTSTYTQPKALNAPLPYIQVIPKQ